MGGGCVGRRPRRQVRRAPTSSQAGAQAGRRQHRMPSQGGVTLHTGHRFRHAPSQAGFGQVRQGALGARGAGLALCTNRVVLLTCTRVVGAGATRATIDGEAAGGGDGDAALVWRRLPPAAKVTAPRRAASMVEWRNANGVYLHSVSARRQAPPPLAAARRGCHHSPPRLGSRAGWQAPLASACLPVIPRCLKHSSPAAHAASARSAAPRTRSRASSARARDIAPLLLSARYFKLPSCLVLLLGAARTLGAAVGRARARAHTGRRVLWAS